MLFYLKRLTSAIVANKSWALIIPLSLLLYFIYAAVVNVRYSITQSLGPYNPEIPLAVAHNPIQTIEFNYLVNQPSLLFLEGFSLKQIQNGILVLQDLTQDVDDNRLSRLINETMSLELVEGDRLDIIYLGDNLATGKFFVEYYSQRLLTRISDGLVRSKSDAIASGPRPALMGEIVISTQRSVWDKERLGPLAWVFAISTLFTLILVAYIEFTNPAFKSEREMAQYLGLPVLGIVPNVDRIASAMPVKPS